MLHGLQSITLLLSNIIEYLRVRNGIADDETIFHWFPEDETYHEPWKRSRNIGITYMEEFESVITKGHIDTFSKEDILAIYKTRKHNTVEELLTDEVDGEDI